MMHHQENAPVLQLFWNRFVLFFCCCCCSFWRFAASDHKWRLCVLFGMCTEHLNYKLRSLSWWNVNLSASDLWNFCRERLVWWTNMRKRFIWKLCSQSMRNCETTLYVTEMTHMCMLSLRPSAPPPPKRAPTTALSMRSKSMTSELEELGKNVLLWPWQAPSDVVWGSNVTSLCSVPSPLYSHWLVNLSIVDKGKQLTLHNLLLSILL